ncbi:MAG: dUTP diphosphatase [Coriobacteriales bacterium]|jgi:dUTP pyrophosphatase|nr:dUTP diphosphatase [Coriobacteriales bacterium]
MSITLQIQRLDKDLPLPAYAYPGDAGLDLRSTIDLTLAPFERALVPTGLRLAIPEGFAGFVQPRSGLALRLGLSQANTPGLIDSHYRGEVQVVAVNLDAHDPVQIKRGERIAQLVVLAVPVLNIVECDELDNTERGEGGFGSSGV